MDTGRLVELIPQNCTWDGPWKGNVIILPGGAYIKLSPREADPVGEALANAGWKPWILYYTVYNGEPLKKRPVCEAAEAVRYVRRNGAKGPVVLCGFSAGGHISACLGVHWNDDECFPKDEQSIIRPDGLILGYPVTTIWPAFSLENREILLGSKDSMTEEEWENGVRYYCLENYVDENTPPAFLWHTAEDGTVPVQNSLLFAGKLAQHHVPFELHIYPYGVHGLSLATPIVDEPEKKRVADPHVAGWFDECTAWLDTLT